jgi:class 3 adenylate cyclase/pimeloyl-ACP methyl ester carboxylesterase
MDFTTGYAQLGDDRVAYQVIGDGRVDVVLTVGWWGSFDIEIEDAAIRTFYEQMASYARVIRFDRRGAAASDPIPLDALPPSESFAEEIECVMDAVGSDRAAIVAAAGAGPAGMFFAATHPDRVLALVLYQTTARYLEDEDYPIGFSEQVMEGYQRRFREGWGAGDAIDILIPSRAGDDRFRSWYSKVQRSISSPSAIQKYMEAESAVDARDLLSAINVPTLVIHRTANEFFPPEWGRYLASHIDGAVLVEHPGGDISPYWDRPGLFLDTFEEFLTGTRREAPKNRQLATILFTDIVGSTRTAEALGDRRWRALLDLHDDTARVLVADHAGHFVKTTGDGIVATFDGPGRAIRAAIELRYELSRADLRIRTGIHAGEIEVRGNEIGGIAVHLAARIMAEARADEILVSRTVRDLVVGSEIAFQDRGTHELKGIQGDWQLFSVVQPDGALEPHESA